MSVPLAPTELEPPQGGFFTSSGSGWAGHAQTVASALWAQRYPGAAPRWQRERWATPDGDFVEVDHLLAPTTPEAPCLVLFHGLEGSLQSHYAQALAHVARQRGWPLVLPHFRGCGGAINHGPRAYHSGDFAEIDWMLRRVRQLHPGRPLYALGVSLGGNALLRWAGEAGQAALEVVRAVAAVSAPLDVAAAGHAMDRGVNRWLYVRRFLHTMRAKARAKWRQYPGLFDLEAALRARTLYAFDDAFTAPLHGFAGVDDYWQRASALPGLQAVQVPALLLNARNDPFVPAASLPTCQQVSAAVTLWQPAWGGHVGFAGPLDGRARWRLQIWAWPERVLDWLHQQPPA